jgi:hypothetical protein
MKRTMKKSLTSFLVVFLMSCVIASARSDAENKANEIDVTQNLHAKRWTEAFSKLDATKNITIVIEAEDNLIEIENVLTVEAFSRFLIVRTKHPNGRIYRMLVYPGSILLIKEAPRTVPKG